MTVGHISHLAAIGLAIAAGPGCVTFPAFSCSQDDQCSSALGAGICERDVGLCSFVDGTCDSGRRFGEAAGDLSEKCVEGQRADLSDAGPEPGDDPERDAGDGGGGGGTDAGGGCELDCDPPLNAGDTCAEATELPIGVAVLDQTTTPLHDDYGDEWKQNPACDVTSLSYNPGRDGVYRLIVPGGQTLRLALRMDTALDCYYWPFQPTLFLFTDCADVGGSCRYALTAQDIHHGDLEYSNTSDAPLHLFVAIDQAYSFGDGHGCYSIQADLL